MPRSPLPRAGGADSPATLDDAALLALFTTAGTALCDRAGGLRPALELPEAPELLGRALLDTAR